jgi:hypothetical protein
MENLPEDIVYGSVTTITPEEGLKRTIAQMQEEIHYLQVRLKEVIDERDNLKKQFLTE